jgi:membrane protease YdiL (CAAX protease family)
LTPHVDQPLASTVRRIQVGSVIAGMVILLMRPAVASTVGWTVPVVVLVFTAVMVLGLAAPIEHEQPQQSTSATTLVAVAAVGVLAFVAGRLLSAGHAPVPATALIIGLNTLAAVAEEALFRRLAFGLLLPAGPGYAIVGSALLFGLAHVTVYGWWAFPVDAAAGAVLGWERWASGSWALPAATHALADLLLVI